MFSELGPGASLGLLEVARGLAPESNEMVSLFGDADKDKTMMKDLLSSH